MNLFLLSIYAIFSLSFAHGEQFSESAEGKIEVNISENQSKDLPEMDDQPEKSLGIQDIENTDFQEQASVERPDDVAEAVQTDEDDQQLTTDEEEIAAEAPSEKPLPKNEEKHEIEKESDIKEESKIEEEETRVEEKVSEENIKDGEHENNDNDVQEQSELNEGFYDALTDTDNVLDLEFYDALCGSSVDPPTDSQEKFPCPTPRPVVAKSGSGLYNFLKSKASSVFNAAANFYKIAADYFVPFKQCIDAA
ncbi:hypothetical protein T11_556 [Trichinella zimbabwensis]|uniref:Replicase polyprotein 1a n=1 Tax=Trichinella zimbabwensis TaxID=268475 RepID=A0A0V1I5Z8_9BILA|nr:hypothetical protein T11_556 [Trichinella zimbabwensis]